MTFHICYPTDTNIKKAFANNFKGTIEESGKINYFNNSIGIICMFSHLFHYFKIFFPRFQKIKKLTNLSVFRRKKIKMLIFPRFFYFDTFKNFKTY